MRARLMSAVAGLQAVVTALAIPVVLLVGEPQPTVAGLVAAGAVALVLVAGLTRRRAGLVAGWAVEVFLVVVAFQSLPLLALTLLFAGLWFAAIRVGGRIDREREAFRPDSA